MPDMEKVIKGVEHCFHGQECCGDIECPYYIEHLSDCCCLEECQENLKADVIALLKEQQADINTLKRAYNDLAEKGQPVVRCMDCKHAVAQDCEQVWCSFVDDGLAHEPDWFCADGERKDGT